MGEKQRARELLHKFRGNTCSFGFRLGTVVSDYAAEYGKRVLVIANQQHLAEYVRAITEELVEAGLEVVGKRVFAGARPNAPKEDVYRIESYILHYNPDCIIAIGGGSTIDAVKAANVLASLAEFNPDIDHYFGQGVVSNALQRTEKNLWPMIAVQTVASSGAHLTKYSNVTDPLAGQKKLIVDEAIVPPRAVFDYQVTCGLPVNVTIDGILDTLAHCIEVFYGANSDSFALLQEITEVALGLVLNHLDDPTSHDSREALGLASDLGGYAIMVGGTNGAHLTSFSLVDVTSHGRACGLMNPYYTVFFAPAIERQLQVIGKLFYHKGLLEEDPRELAGRELGKAVARGLIKISGKLGAPTRLTDLEGFREEHVQRALTAAKNPQLEMKLANMPISLSSAEVDKLIGPILQAAKTGEFDLIKLKE